MDEWEARHPDDGEPSAKTNRGYYRLDGGIKRVLRRKISELAEAVERVRVVVD